MDGKLTAEGQRALTHEGRLNELRIAAVRAFAYIAIFGIALWNWAAGLRPLSVVATTAAVAALSIGLVFLVRHRYRPWIRFAVPLLDAAAIVWLLQRRAEDPAATPMVVAVAAVACTFFAATGALRFDRGSAIWTTFLAAVAVLVIAAGRIPEAVPYLLIGILGVGAMNVWQTGFIHRLARGEQGRALLRKFIHKGVVDRAFTDPSQLAAAPRSQIATVLVSDLRGFTRLAETMDPAEVVNLLNEVHGVASDVVTANGGVIDKFLGDGMLAVFGAPEPLAEHTARAVQAAVQLAEAVEALNAGRPDREPLKIGVGVHTGPVVSGIIGGGRKSEFTVIGDTVNIASRIESLTKEHQVTVLLTADTARASGGGPFRDIGEVTLRGRRDPVRLFTPAPGFAPRLLDPLSLHSATGQTK